jgi:hypothetical protein
MFGLPGVRSQGAIMKSLNALGLAVALLLGGALVGEPAFAYRGGHGYGGKGSYVVKGGHYAVKGHYGGHGYYGAKGHYYGGYGYRSRVIVGVGFPVYWGPWYYPPAYYYPPYYPYYPPAYSAPTYVEQADEQAPPGEQPSQWWYYCADAKAYYPYVKECPGGWQRVAPQPPPPR